MKRKTSVNAPVTLFLHSIHASIIIFVFILQSIRGVQFEITAIQIFRERMLSLKNVSKKVV